jgi:hypothetical protein
MQRHTVIVSVNSLPLLIAILCAIYAILMTLFYHASARFSIAQTKSFAENLYRLIKLGIVCSADIRTCP